MSQSYDKLLEYMWTVSKGLMLDVMKSTCGPLPSDGRPFLITLDGSIINLLFVNTISRFTFLYLFNLRKGVDRYLATQTRDVRMKEVCSCTFNTCRNNC